MKDIRDRVKTFNKRAGTVVLIVVALLLSASLSWADTSVYAYLIDDDGTLQVYTLDSDGDRMGPIEQLPNSCFTPELFWDSSAGTLRINGFGSTGLPLWTGTINASGQFTPPAGKVYTDPDCNNSAVPDAVSAVYPDFTIVPCASWTPGLWVPASCYAPSIQTRTVTGVPAGCVGNPNIITVQTCPSAPLACNSWTYNAWSPTDASCTPGQTQTRTVATYSPAGCTGGPSPSQLSKTCNAPTCTNWTYTAWSPSEATCTAGQTLTRSILTSSPNPCTGGNPVLSEPCPNGTNAPNITTYFFNKPGQHWTLAAGEAKVLKVTVPVCNTTSKQVRFSLGGLQSNPTAHIFAKKVNGDPSRVPTRDDYNKLYALTANGKGPYVDCVPTADGTTCTSKGDFFWKFNGDANGETLIVYSAYNNMLLGAPISLKTTIPNFTQAGDYYLYVINVGSFPGDDRSMEVHVGANCY